MRGPIGRALVVGMALSLLLSACGGGAGSTASPIASAPAQSQPATTAAADIGPAEQTTLKVALPFPDRAIYLPFLIGTDEGYFAEEGLTIGEITDAFDTRAALIGGSVDVAIGPDAAAYQAAAEDLDITAFSGYMCRNLFSFAVQPEVNSAADLNGKDVVLTGLPGDTTEFARAYVLAQNGWSLEGVDVNPVYPGPDSAQWREFFIAGKVALIPFYSDDVDALNDYGAKVIFETAFPVPGFVMMARKDWLAENPNTAARLLRALMRSVQFYIAPEVGAPMANKARMLEILKAHDFPTEREEASTSSYALGSASFCPNLHLGQDGWDLTQEMQKLTHVPFEEAANIDALVKAQASLGLDNSAPPEIPFPEEGS